MLMPSDRTGENSGWQSTEPYCDDFYAIWDTFRSSGPLLTLIAPERQTAMVRALIDIYRHEGWLPDAAAATPMAAPRAAATPSSSSPMPT
jgi:putative alpha-1,2-mannosidase